jgi:hypothetical protein
MKQADGFLTASTSGNIKVLTESEIKAGYTEGGLIRDDESNGQSNRWEKLIFSHNSELETILTAASISPNQNLTNQVKEALDILYQPLGAGNFSKGYINGGVISNDGTTPDEIIDITALEARSSDDTKDITVSAGSLDITLTASYASGTVPSLTSTTIHTWADYNSGTERFIFDDVTGSNLTDTGKARRVGSMITDSSGDIIPFASCGKAGGGVKIIRQFIPEHTSLSPTSLTYYSISVPIGIRVTSLLTIESSSSNSGSINSYVAGDDGYEFDISRVNSNSHTNTVNISDTVTSNAQIGLRCTNGDIDIAIYSNGYIDERVV